MSQKVSSSRQRLGMVGRGTPRGLKPRSPVVERCVSFGGIDAESLTNPLGDGRCCLGRRHDVDLASP